MNGRILLIVSHPDDEAMFFSPFLSSMASKRMSKNINVLCLSTGNYDGLGDMRRSELYASCSLFGILGQNINVIDHNSLQDGEIWSPSIIAEIVVNISKEIQPECIITFDDYGVSGHINHIATYRGVVAAMPEIFEILPNIQGYKLDSLKGMNMIFRKFIGVFDILFTSIINLFNNYDNIRHNSVKNDYNYKYLQQNERHDHLTGADATMPFATSVSVSTSTSTRSTIGSNTNRTTDDQAYNHAPISLQPVQPVQPVQPSQSFSLLQSDLSPMERGTEGKTSCQMRTYTVYSLHPLPAWRAMAAHRSQFVWYRRMFIILSRYSYVNTFSDLLSK